MLYFQSGNWVDGSRYLGNRGIPALPAMSLPQLQEAPHRESIDRFLARLPSLWQQGEARPTHKARVRPPRHWCTRKDPFEGVWRDVLLWLRKDPDTNAKGLLAKLCETYPGRFGDAQLRTLQRRVKDWRGVMAGGWSTLLPMSLHRNVARRWNQSWLGWEIRDRISVTFSGEAIRRQS